MKKDIFADIAAGGIGKNSSILEDPKPIEYNVGQCLLKENGKKPLVTKEEMSSEKEMKEELQKLKNKFAPFLQNKAPEIESYTEKIKIDEFLFNSTETVKIPHYWGPVGYAKNIYEAEFTLDDIMEGKAYYVCFKGADYMACVYVNDECVGMHEGFFSPFEFQITEQVRKGANKLKIVLKNDWIYRHGDDIEGDKLYAATGLGFDDPQVGWHHCPPGTGIYNDVTVEIRNYIHITDLFVRNENEVWVEVQNSTYDEKDVEFYLSVYGQNFDETVCENVCYKSCELPNYKKGDEEIRRINMKVKKGQNIYRLPLHIENCRKWDLDTPYLYQLQLWVTVDGEKLDAQKTQFGIRSFTQDVESEMKGMFYLNGRKIRLRGANTMGFEQQDVLRGDIEQLIDDILLAKVCNMNYLRLTQRPVQDEVYEYCDKLGMLTQTDLPLFGWMRRTKIAEAIRQTEEMERMVRNHPCNIMVTYINEPMSKWDEEPHRHLERSELEEFFKACDVAVKLLNPERVIKHVDGDYYPPGQCLPDNHCYTMWYNGHGIDAGRLNKGYWFDVKPGWYFGCGEYGAEGLDFADVMRSYYPESWIREPFNPDNIIGSQTGKFHYFFYDTPDSLEEWVEASQEHQEKATKFMTEAFRRNPRMVSFAIHLFIDAWPSGWMKTIMDFKRKPKPAFFAYKKALKPLMVSLRTDRYTYYEGEKITVEAYVCNDTSSLFENLNLTYELYDKENLIMSSETTVSVEECDVQRADDAVFTINKVNDRKKYTLKVILSDNSGEVIDYNHMQLEVFEDVEIRENTDVVLVEKLPVGEHTIAGEKVIVKECGMQPVHFVSRKTGHKCVSGFEAFDFSNWYDKDKDMITPILETTFEAEGFTPILTGSNKDGLWNGDWAKTFAAAEKTYDGKKYVICQVDLRMENPIAKRFLKRIYEL